MIDHPAHVTITASKRLPNSTNGNPRFLLALSDGTIRTTQADSACSYDIENLTRSRQEFSYTTTKAGRISEVRVAVRQQGSPDER